MIKVPSLAVLAVYNIPNIGEKIGSSCLSTVLIISKFIFEAFSVVLNSDMEGTLKRVMNLEITNAKEAEQNKDLDAMANMLKDLVEKRNKFFYVRIEDNLRYFSPQVFWKIDETKIKKIFEGKVSEENFREVFSILDIIVQKVYSESDSCWLKFIEFLLSRIVVYGYLNLIRELREFPKARDISVTSLGGAVRDAACEGYVKVIQELRKFHQAGNISAASLAVAVERAACGGYVKVIQELRKFHQAGNISLFSLTKVACAVCQFAKAARLECRFGINLETLGVLEELYKFRKYANFIIKIIIFFYTPV